jgi:hypothetical protein
MSIDDIWAEMKAQSALSVKNPKNDTKPPESLVESNGKPVLKMSKSNLSSSSKPAHHEAPKDPLLAKLLNSGDIRPLISQSSMSAAETDAARELRYEMEM